MNKLFHKLKMFPKRSSLILYAALFCVIFFSVIAVLLTNLGNVSSQFGELNALCFEIKEGEARVNSAQQLLSGIVSYSDAESISRIDRELDSLQSYYTSLEVPLYDYETYYQFHSLLNMLGTYRENSEKLIEAIAQNNLTNAGNIYARTDSIAANMRTMSDRLSSRMQDHVGLLAQRISRQLRLFRICLPVFAVMILGYLLLMARRLDRRFIMPIYHLSDMAQKISEGDYPSVKTDFGDDSDFNRLSDTMFSMSRTIQDNIEELNNRARIAQELNAKTIENLEIKTMYNRLELRRLQEQINPHFLFNCMSTLHHTAYLEGAEQTCDICNTISCLLRYNFRQTDAVGTLAGELGNIADYTYIQSIRFGNRIILKTDIETDLPEVQMPRMILQPIVENCYNHGLVDKTSGGVITLNVKRCEGFVRVCIHDNGCGLKQDKIDALMEMFANDKLTISDHTHVGMLNVVKRLQRFYNRNDVIALTNDDGLCVTLYLYLSEETDYE